MKRILHGQSIYLRTYTNLYLVLITYLVLLVATPFTVAQAPQAAFAFAPSVQVGGTPQTQTVPVTITPTGVFNHAHYLTQGSAALDFTFGGAVICSGMICNVPVS